MTHSSESIDELIAEIDSLLAKDRSSLSVSGRQLLRQSRGALKQIRDDPSSFTEEERRKKLATAAKAFLRLVADPDVFAGLLGYIEELT